MIPSRYQCFSLVILMMFALATPVMADTSLESTRLYLDNLNAQVKTLVREVSDGSVAEQETAKVTLRTILTDRKNEMLALARQSPRLFLTLVMPDFDRTALVPELQVLVERKTSARGQLEVSHSDFLLPDGKGFDSEKSRYDYVIRTGRGPVDFYPSSFLGLRSGAEVSVSGYQLDSSLVVNTDASGSFELITAAPAVAAVGDQRTLVFLIDFLDSPPHPYTPAEVNDLIFNGYLQDFYREQSYGQVSFSGEVMGWFRLPRNGNVGGGECQWGGAPILGSYADVTEELLPFFANIPNLDQYDRLVEINLFPESCPSGPAAGSSMVGGGVRINDVYYDMSRSFIRVGESFPNFYKKTLAHEIGHGLGLMHANSWRCTDGEILYGNCTHTEYGSILDTMGSNEGHFNAYFKDALGWLGSDSLLISESGRYTLAPLESSNGFRGAKIQPPGLGPIFSIENRQAIGFDQGISRPDMASNQNGLLVNYIVYPPPIAPLTRLLDMSPLTPKVESSLNVGDPPFTDTVRGVTIGPVISADATGVTFDIKIGNSCLAITYVPNSYQSAVSIGSSVSSVFNLQHNSTCPANTYMVNVNQGITGLTYIFDPPSFSMMPGQSLPIGLSISVSSLAVPGQYNTTVDFRDITTGDVQSITIPVAVTFSPTLQSVTPLTGVPGTMINITGTGFMVGNNPPNEVLWQQPIGVTRASQFAVSTDGRNLVVPIPNIPAGTYRLRVSAFGLTGSQLVFNVGSSPSNPSSLNVLSPNGGESIYLGDPLTVRWQTSNIPPASGVTIKLKSMLDSSEKIISSGSLNDGQEIIPATLLSNPGYFRVIVNAADGGVTFSDQSDNQFEFLYRTIPPTVTMTITSPAAGATWLAGSSKTVRWFAENAPGGSTVSIYYRPMGNPVGVGEILLADNLPHVGPNADEGVVTVPSDILPGYYYLRAELRSDGQTLASGQGGPVSITAPLPVTLTMITPNGGEQWAKGSTQNITWQTSNGLGTETYDLFVRGGGTDGKKIYSVASDVSGQSYAWSVGWQAGRLALVPDGLYYLRVCISGNDQVRCDSSDRPFTIYTPTKDGGGGPVKQREILPDQDLTASVFSFFRNLFPAFFGH